MNLRTRHLVKRQYFTLRALHKSASSDAPPLTAAREEESLRRGEESRPGPVRPLTLQGELSSRVKTLREMPGPSTFANLVEFFYRDGFSRIHEIQVRLEFYSSFCHFLAF